MIVLVGRIYTYRKKYPWDGAAGYFMVMSKSDEHVSVSPLFWSEDVVIRNYDRAYFKEAFEPFHETLPARLLGQFDFQRIRRWGMINAHQSSANVDGYRRSGRASQHVQPRQRRRPNRR